MGRVAAVCISENKGTGKSPVFTAIARAEEWEAEKAAAIHSLNNSDNEEETVE